MSNDTRHLSADEYAPRFDEAFSGRSAEHRDALAPGRSAEHRDAPPPRPSMRPLPPQPAYPYQHAPEPAQAPYVAPPAPPVAAPAPMASDPTAVTLSRAYRAHDLEVRHVKFRKPTTKDLRSCGYPLRNVIGVGGQITGVDEVPDNVAKYIAALAEPPLPPSTVNELEIQDYAACSAVILGFFIS